MSPLFPHLLLIFQEYLLHASRSVRVVLHPFVVEDVCKGRLDLALVVEHLVIGGIASAGQQRIFFGW